jgi:hypothetical protein
MSKVVAGMTMSIDGYVEDRTGGVGALYADLATLKETEPLREDIENRSVVLYLCHRRHRKCDYPGSEGGQRAANYRSRWSEYGAPVHQSGTDG